MRPQIGEHGGLDAAERSRHEDLLSSRQPRQLDRLGPGLVAAIAGGLEHPGARYPRQDPAVGGRGQHDPRALDDEHAGACGLEHEAVEIA